MSEAERKRRLDYRKTRKKWISWQAAILALVLLVSLTATVFAIRCGKTKEISYYEKTQLDYGVYLKENEFYNQSYLGKDYTYVAALIDRVAADFRYQIYMDSERPVDFRYSYSVVAVLEILNNSTGKVMFNNYKTEVLPEKTFTSSGKNVIVYERVEVDYAQFDALAKEYIAKYELDGVSANIKLEMHVNVEGSSAEFDTSKNKNSYVSSLSIPVAAKTVNVQISSSIPPEESKILGYNPNQAYVSIFRVVAISAATLAFLLLLALIGFIYLTRNTDVTYDIKVGKLLKSYKPYIQRIKNAFDTAGYQMLFVEGFEEMLEIRDTIQSPILMNENGDRTCTSFYIPTATKILYVFEIKVEDYDEIYNRAPEPEAEETVAVMTEPDAAEVVPTPVEAIVEEAVEATPEVALEAQTEAIPEAEDSENAKSSYFGMRRSFLAKLIQADAAKKQYYSSLKNELLSYRGVRARTAWGQESFKKGHTHLAKMSIRGKTLCIYLALDPAAYAESKYFFTDVSDKAQFEVVPMMMKVKSERGVKHAKELIEALAERYGLVKKPSFEPVDYVLPHQTTDELICLGLIKDGSSAEDTDVLLLADVDEAALEAALREPDPVLAEIDYMDRVDEETEDGVEVVDVVWRERESGNILHRYDPDGLTLTDGDVVLVPEENGEAKIRKAAVAHGNHKVSPDVVDSPLQKLLGVIRKRVQSALRSKKDE